MKNLSRKEAITILESMRIDIPVPKAAVTQIKRNLALDMAINALNCSEIPNKSDTISRQEAIEAFDGVKVDEENCTEYDIGYNDGIDFAVSRLSVLPAVQPEQWWIPCSERLPKKPNVYTVTDSNDRVVRFVFTGTDSSREYWKRCAKAWMPLPEPYKEDEQG